MKTNYKKTNEKVMSNLGYLQMSLHTEHCVHTDRMFVVKLWQRFLRRMFCRMRKKWLSFHRLTFWIKLLNIIITFKCVNK